VPVKSTATDAFQFRTWRAALDARLVLDDKRPVAVVVRWEEFGDVRFGRKAK
jgi:hypothetical protein